MGGAKRYPSIAFYEDDGFRGAPPIELGDLPVGRFVDGAVESYFGFPEKYFCSHSPQITSRTLAIPPHQRGVSRSSRTRGGMRWTRQRQARNVVAGRVGERPVSDRQRADERCCCVRRSRVVLTPRRWRQVRGVKSAQPGLDKTYPLGDGGKRARSPGRARRKPLKPLRAGMPGDSGVLVVTRVRSITTSAHEAAGATGTRRSPRPLWAEDASTPRAHRVERMRTHAKRPTVIARA